MHSTRLVIRTSSSQREVKRSIQALLLSGTADRIDKFSYVKTYTKIIDSKKIQKSLCVRIEIETSQTEKAIKLLDQSLGQNYDIISQ